MLQFVRGGKCFAAVRAIQWVRFCSFDQKPRDSDEVQKHFAERLGVNLCGQIYKKSIKMENGNILVPLITKTVNDESQEKHQVIVSRAALEYVSDDWLCEGARIFVRGSIYYKTYQSDDGRPRNHGQILSDSVFLCKYNEDPSNDINEITLFGYVDGRPRITANATFITIVTAFFSRTQGIYKRNFHNVMITDNEKMRKKVNCLEKGTGVSIHGFLNSRFGRSIDGRFQSRYFIRPKHLIVTPPGETHSD